MLKKTTLLEIERLIESGDEFLNHDEFVQALAKYHEAEKLLPAPKYQFDISLQVFVAIGEAHFFAGDYQQACKAFQTAMKAPGGLENPLTHLRLGQTFFELSMDDKAADELTKAYMLDGRDIFSDEDDKYLDFLATRIAL